MFSGKYMIFLTSYTEYNRFFIYISNKSINTFFYLLSVNIFFIKLSNFENIQVNIALLLLQLFKEKN